MKNKVVLLGVKEPNTLTEWADVGLRSNHLPWLQGAELIRLRRMLEFFLRGAKAKTTPVTRRSLLTGQILARGFREIGNASRPKPAAEARCD